MILRTFLSVSCLSLIHIFEGNALTTGKADRVGLQASGGLDLTHLTAQGLLDKGKGLLVLLLVLFLLMFNAAIPLIAKNPEFKSLHEYYTTRANNPLKKKQSVIAISCKLIRVFYAILAKGVTYDAQKLISDIHRQPQVA